MDTDIVWTGLPNSSGEMVNRFRITFWFRQLRKTGSLLRCATEISEAKNEKSPGKPGLFGMLQRLVTSAEDVTNPIPKHRSLL